MKKLLLIVNVAVCIASLIGFLYLFLMRNSGLAVLMGVGGKMISLDTDVLMVIMAIAAVIFAFMAMKIMK